MLSLLLVPLWLKMYRRTPYLFPALVSVLYLFNWADSIVNVLVGFPIRPIYIMKSGKLEKMPKIMAAEQIRALWLLLGLFIPQLTSSQTFAMTLYSVCALLMVELEYYEYGGMIQSKIKMLFYLFWTFTILSSIPFSPINAILALLLHGCNFVIDFRALN